MKLSVVITLFNEQPNIAHLLPKVHEALREYTYELILVDDGSTDRTVEQIKARAYPQVKLLELRKNYGQTTAMQAGIDAARGEYIVTLDGDLQNDPSDIPVMLNRMEKEDWDIIFGIRANRKDSLIRTLPSKIANWIIRRSSGVTISDYGCTLKIFKSHIAKELELRGELHRFIPILAHLGGARVTEMQVKHHHRQYGTSKYGMARILKVFSDLLLMLFFQKYLNKSMHLFGTLGFFALLTGGAINLYLLGCKLMGQDIWGRPILLLGAILFISGIQLIMAGFITEILSRIYYRGEHTTPYRLKSVQEFHHPSSKATRNEPV